MAKGQFIELKDVAHILDCSPDDIVVLARRGDLKAIKKGMYWMFRISDIKAYKNKHTRASLQPTQQGPGTNP